VGSATYRLLVRVLRAVLRLYFRRVEVTGVEDLPATGGGLLVAWHPNGLVDPALILTHVGRRVAFGARHTLFHWPGLGLLLRRIGTVPIYRALDTHGGDAARREANRRSLDALAGEVARGAFACLFPEGLSHDDSKPREIKTGAARLYYRARQLLPAGAAPPAIIPVGLHYNRKRLFRSEAHVVFHPPLALPEPLDVTPPSEEPEEVTRARVSPFTAEIERVLHEVAHATEDWDTHLLLQRVRKLVRAERAVRAGVDPGRPPVVERTLGFARVRAGYRALLARAPAAVATLRARVERYHRDLRALGMDDHQLDRAPRLGSPWVATLLLLQLIAVFVLLPPLLLAGYAINGVPAVLLWGLVRLVARERKDEATLKLLFGLLLFPLAWAGAGVAAWFGHLALHRAFPGIPDVPWAAALSTVALGLIGGVVALRYLELARETARAVRVRLTRARRWYSVTRLRVERAALFDEVMALAAGLELPGAVAEDGTIVERRAS
jgi:glycerol-3-phosphate O-acyltransferase/dihydroxyacetone phosphate acyltransferase